MEPVTLINEIKPLFPSQHQGGEQRQRFPFVLGQLLQATVIAKNETHLFTIDIRGQHITAESSTPLQTGQQLVLQLTSLAPRMELQIINHDLVNRQLNNVLPLLGKESVLLPQLAALADDAALMAQLKPETRETLLLFTGHQDAGKAPPPPLPVPAMINQLADLLVQKTLPASERTVQIPQQEIVTLLQRGSRADPLFPQTAAETSSIVVEAGTGKTASLPPQITAEISRLIELFSRGLADQKLPAPDQPALSRLTAAAPKDAGANLELLAALAGFKTTDSALPAQLLTLHQAYASLPAEHPLQQLLAFLTQTTSTRAMPFLAHRAGEHLSERFSRLGLNMEQLLAENRPEAAMRTLKFALLDLARQTESAPGKSGAAPVQLGQLFELYQLIQHRLANESLVFLPLPFLFLQQGYALIAHDRSNSEAETANKHAKQESQTVALHLRLEGLGNLRVDIRRQEDKITLRFQAEDVGKAKFIAGFHQELEQWLTSGKLESVQFLIGAQEPIKALLEKILPGEAGMINTKA